MEIIACLLLTAVAVQGSHSDHHHHLHTDITTDQSLPDQHSPDCHGPECDLVNQAINNIGMFFDEHLCHAFIHVDCNNHVLPNDEQICASDGQTYDNHCSYAKARCDRVLDKRNYYNGALTNPLLLTNHGPCIVVSTVPVATTTISRMAVSTDTTGSGNTGTTAMSLQSVLGSVFCKNRWSINCGQNFAIVCGSDGKYYPNQCELLKWQCVHPTLRQVSDSNVCASS
ncbi:uncharacterized protein LOC128547389 [Mercenaria mercenaria]|uniref:uncharacterized protein LOC128547389 n=1 Tax=Mercenaria mercenaria TaxID=6596 RepID=UPI00234EF146|nr:uncharacterized protein LOC128547389 [Mercenaria mercenaria]